MSIFLYEDIESLFYDLLFITKPVKTTSISISLINHKRVTGNARVMEIQETLPLGACGR